MRWNSVMRSDQREELLHDPVDSAKKYTQKNRNADHDEGQILGGFRVRPSNFLEFRNCVEPLLFDFIKSSTDRRPLFGAVAFPFHRRFRGPGCLRTTLRQHRLWLDDSLA